MAWRLAARAAAREEEELEGSRGLEAKPAEVRAWRGVRVGCVGGCVGEVGVLWRQARSSSHCMAGSLVWRCLRCDQGVRLVAVVRVEVARRLSTAVGRGWLGGFRGGRGGGRSKPLTGRGPWSDRVP